MSCISASLRIAIVGVGPRGLGAMEALRERSSASNLTLSVDVFDPIDYPGAGPNFSPDESPVCLLNIPVRDIALQPPECSSATSGKFTDSLTRSVDRDSFPTRAELGRYFVKRLEDLVANAPDNLLHSLHKVEVTTLSQADDGWFLSSQHRRYGPYDEILLTQGQPDTKPDEQLSRWQTHADNCGADLLPAYPTRCLLEAARDWANCPVAIRGLGLSTLDVIRLLTIGMGGQFENGTYRPSGQEPSRLLPFSLDGHAPVAKPATASLDDRFNPQPDETCRFKGALTMAMDRAPEQVVRDICQSLVGPTARILKATGSAGGEGDVSQWLAIETNQPGAQETQSTVEALHTGISMAQGQLPPSPGYVVGQLWRKWQSELRNGFRNDTFSPLVAKAIIDFDEGLKRYSYGPPVTTAKQLLVLMEDGLVDPRVAEEPDIALIDDGWQLSTDDASSRAVALVDAVLPSPALDQIADPLISTLRADGRVCCVADGLGAYTRSDGQLIGCHGDVQTGLSVLGRLALGSFVAVDSIHDCFGASAGKWADGVLARAD